MKADRNFEKVLNVVSNAEKTFIQMSLFPVYLIYVTHEVLLQRL
jgi:hypothetical protein